MVPQPVILKWPSATKLIFEMTSEDRLLRPKIDKVRSCVLGGLDGLKGNGQNSIQNSVHTNVACDVCGAKDFCGARYKCSICEDFDLCEECERQENVHPPDHALIKIKSPINASNNYDFDLKPKQGPPSAEIKKTAAKPTRKIAANQNLDKNKSTSHTKTTCYICKQEIKGKVS